MSDQFQTESDYVKLSFLNISQSVSQVRSLSFIKSNYFKLLENSGPKLNFIGISVFFVFWLEYHEYHLTILNLNNKRILFEFIKMRNYLKLKLFHGYYINISIDLRLEPTVAANVVGRVSKYIRKNQSFITSIAIRKCSVCYSNPLVDWQISWWKLNTWLISEQLNLWPTRDSGTNSPVQSGSMYNILTALAHHHHTDRW